MPTRFVTSKARQRLIATDKYVQEELAKEAVASGVRLKAAHDEVVSDWDGKPIFTYVISIQPDRIRVSTRVSGTNKQKWHWVNKGTKGPYLIPTFPRPMPLRFQTGYQAHTQPIAKHHQGSGEATGGWVSTYQVTHPGIKARDFTVTIDREERPIFRRNVENAIRRAIRKAKG